MKWLNEPREWKEEGFNLSLVTEDKTDFWQETHYGFRHDNGHFRHVEMEGDFTAAVTFSADYRAQYDQAGLMLRHGPGSWIKAGVEFTQGRASLASVYTRELSDWAVGPEVPVDEPIQLRLTRKGIAVCVQRKVGEQFITLRLGNFPGPASVSIGMMACSPTQGGLKVRFDSFVIGAPVDFAAEV